MPRDRENGPSDQTEFEEALALSLEQLREGEPLDHALARFPERAAELRPSLQTAQMLQEYFAQEARASQAASTPLLAKLRDGVTGGLSTMMFGWRAQSSLWHAHGYLRWFSARVHPQTGSLHPEAYRRGWASMEAALDGSPHARPAAGWSARFRLAGALALLLLLFGAVIWSQPDALAGAMPGQPLYPLKRALERADLIFARDAASRAQLHLELAARRLDETRYLFQHRQPVTPGQIDEVKTETLAALEETARADPRAQPSLLAQLLVLTHQEEQFFNDLLAQVEPALQQEILQVLAVVHSVQAEGQQELNNLVPPPAVPTLSATVAAPTLLPSATPLPISTPTTGAEATIAPVPSATPVPLLPTLPPTLLPTVNVSSPPATIAVPTLPPPPKIQPTLPPLSAPTLPAPTLPLPTPRLPLPTPVLRLPTLPAPTLALP